jgi:RNA-binding protein YhbY
MTPFEKAERAKQLLDDPLLKEVLSGIRERLVLKLEISPMDDVDTHHTTALSLQLLKQISTDLNRYIGESAVIAHRQKNDSFINRVRERFA